MKFLSDLFLESRGEPVCFNGARVIQIDRIEIAPISVVEIKFTGWKHYTNNAAVIAVRKNARILLSDGSSADAVAIWDDPTLPRFASHVVESSDGVLEVYNKYRIFHSEDCCTEDSFTGNAGMIVETTSHNCKTYRCSNGIGAFSPSDLVFELCWRPHS